MKSFDSALEILYEDNHVLVVNKKAGLLTQPNQSSEKNLEDLRGLEKLTDPEEKTRNPEKRKNLEKKLEKQDGLFLKLLHTQKIVTVIRL